MGISHPVKILYDNRTVKPKFGPEGINLILRSVQTQHNACWVSAGHQLDQEKRKKRNYEYDHYGHCQSSENKSSQIFATLTARKGISDRNGFGFLDTRLMLDLIIA